MTRYLIGTAILVLSFASLHAQIPASGNLDCFKAVETEYNFGRVDGGVPVSHTFVFKNTCNKTVEIDQIRPSCGCTAAVISEKVIKAGGEAKIDVKFTPPQGSRGKVSKTVSVYLRDKAEVHATLRFSADMKTFYDIEPRSFQLQNATVGTPVTARATMKNTGEKDLDIRDLNLMLTSYKDTVIAGSKSNVTYSLQNGKILTPKSFSLAPGQSKSIEITLTPEYAGQVLGNLRISTAMGDESVPVTGAVQQAFLVR